MANDDYDDLIPTRRSLLDRLKNWEDQASWREFFDTYWKLIYRISLQAGLSDAEAQDVVQETMLSVSRQMPSFEYDPKKGSFKAWLMQLTGWRIKDQMRKRQPALVRLSDPATAGGGEDGLVDPHGLALEQIWEREWETHLFEQAVNRVKQRVDGRSYQIYYLYVVKNWPAPRVAKAFNITTARVYLAKHRVGRLIAKEIKQLGAQAQ